MKIPYRVYLANFGYFVDAEFDTLEAAIARAKDSGFECAIRLGGVVVAVVNAKGDVRYVVKNNEIEAEPR